MEIIIGREGSSEMSIGRRLRVVTPQKKDIFIGHEGSVPQTVSRQHCKLTIDDAGNMTVTNMKAANITYVNGQEIFQKSITKSDRLELGSERYPLDLCAILDKIEIPQTFDISHLQAVWNEYETTKTALQIKAQKSAAIQSVTGIFSMASIACGFIPSIPNTLRIVLYVVAFGLGVTFFVYRMHHAGENILRLKNLEDDFHRKYVCPNPKCQRFLGNIPYNDLIRQSKSCFVCKSNYTIKQ